MSFEIRVDQNRLDYCVELVNKGFYHIGTIFDKYDIYYSEAKNYTYEIWFSLDDLTYRIYGYAGRYETEKLTYIQSQHTEQTGGGCMVDYLEMNDGKIIGITDECVCV